MVLHTNISDQIENQNIAPEFDTLCQCYRPLATLCYAPDDTNIVILPTHNIFLYLITNNLVLI